MIADIYKTYYFDFDRGTYLKEFKNALENFGIKKPEQFNQLLKNAGIDSYDIETVKSYFYGRRVPPLNVLIAVCKSLHISADSIAFPQSIQSPKYDGDLCDAEDLFRNIFFPYNAPLRDGDPIDLTEFFCAETYKKDVDKLALILSRYNYLIQKYHYADVPNHEIRQICQFSERYIIERGCNDFSKWASVRDWIKDCKEENFLDAFYNKYTIAFYCRSCYSLLDILSTAISSEFINYAMQLLPERDKMGK